MESSTAELLIAANAFKQMPIFHSVSLHSVRPFSTILEETQNRWHYSAFPEAFLRNNRSVRVLYA